MHLRAGLGLLVLLVAMPAWAGDGTPKGHPYRGKPIPPKQACERICAAAKKQCLDDCKDENGKDNAAVARCSNKCPQEVAGCMKDCEENMSKKPGPPPTVIPPQMPEGEPSMPEVPPASGDGE